MASSSESSDLSASPVSLKKKKGFKSLFSPKVSLSPTKSKIQTSSHSQRSPTRVEYVQAFSHISLETPEPESFEESLGPALPKQFSIESSSNLSTSGRENSYSTSSFDDVNEGLEKDAPASQKDGMRTAASDHLSPDDGAGHISIDSESFATKSRSTGEEKSIASGDSSSLPLRIRHNSATQTGSKCSERNCFNGLPMAFKDDKFSDLTLIVQEHEFKVHKVILSEFCSKFKTMLEDGTIPPNQDKFAIDILDDLEPKVMKEILRYIYTGSFEYTEETVKDILIAADRFDLSALKALCEDAIFKFINDENAHDMLIFAHNNKCLILKECVIDYIFIQSSTLAAKDVQKIAFDILLKEYPQLILELFYRILDLYHSK